MATWPPDSVMGGLEISMARVMAAGGSGMGSSVSRGRDGAYPRCGKRGMVDTQ